MISDTEIKIKGEQILARYLGDVEAVRFIALIQRERFDYTKWRQDMNESLSVKELSQSAMVLRDEKKKASPTATIGNNEYLFSEAVTCAKAFGFQLDRVNGSHHIFTHKDISELLNLQNVKGKAKPNHTKSSNCYN